jgi:integrase
MASLSTNSKGLRRILFVDGAGERRCVHLGRLPQKAAEAFLRRVEELSANRIAGVANSTELASWLGNLPEPTHAKLVRVELVEPRAAANVRTVGELLDTFEQRAVVKPSTRKAYKQTTDSLRAFLGAETALQAVTAETADAWRKWIATDTTSVGRKRGTADNRLSPATCAKRTFVARTVFRKAVRWGWIATSPFEGIQAGSQANPSRAFYVSPEDTTAILGRCPDVEWRSIVGLTRYAGLRCPSELASLVWSDIDWEAGRLTVRASKTEHHGGGHAVRHVPICPALRAILDEAWEQAADRSTAVVPRAANGNVNLRTTFEKIITRAGLVPWPRLFQNLRSSCETDWVEAYPAHEVAAWLGHSPAVAARHYLQRRDHHFRDVVANGLGGDAQSDARGAQNRAQQVPARNRKESLPSPEDDALLRFMRTVAASCDELNTCSMGDIGTELQRSRPRKTAILRTGDAQSDAQAQLQAMAVAWSRLPQASRQRIAQVIRDEFEQAAVAERRTLG